MKPNSGNRQVTLLYLIIHVSAWMILFLLPFAIFDVRLKSSFSLFNLLFVGKALVVFYLNYYLLVPRFLLQKKVFTYIIWVALIVSALAFIDSRQNEIRRKPYETTINTTIPEHPATAPKAGQPVNPPRMLGNVPFILMIIGVSTSLKLSQAWFQNEQTQQDIKKEHLATELAFLKSQINPHFLFNSLNSIYSLAFKKSDLAPEAILRLSKIMRYVLDESPSTCVPLEKELDHLQDYVELQKLRLTEKTKLSFVVDNQASNQTIEPMLLVPFIENAFKHGADTTVQSVITIKINISANQLVFQSTNTIAQRNPNQTEQDSGIGLKNVARRLQMLYPGHHKLEVVEEKNLYAVTLFLTLKQHEMHNS
ncbi:MAG: sensor histidine kinase [Salinivirgaceae bacterium]